MVSITLQPHCTSFETQGLNPGLPWTRLDIMTPLAGNILIIYTLEPYEHVAPKGIHMIGRIYSFDIESPFATNNEYSKTNREVYRSTSDR